MSEGKPRSLQDILKRRQQEEFVGREEQLTFFRDNLRRNPGDPHRRFIINVHGQGGVGKTWLLRQFLRIAEDGKALTACTDEIETDVPGVMNRIAAQYGTRKHPLKSFAERYKVYRQRKQEIEADPEAPQGFPALLGQTLTRGGLHLARRIPVAGIAVDFVDEEAAATLVGNFASFVARKIRNKDEVRLVLEPVEVLTPLFLADLRNVGADHPVALFFDTYERTGEYLDTWLRDLLDGRYGEVPADIVLNIAGREELDHNCWAPYEGMLARLPLDPFTEKEAHNYLARKGITDERVVEVILSLSGGLPLLVATLAAERPDDPSKVGDPSGEAVERFLKWVEDRDRRQVAVDAALPRRLNQDVMAALATADEPATLFEWLKDMAFIENHGVYWTYHPTVRAQMLRHKLRSTPQGWSELHGRLANHYESLRDRIRLDEAIKWESETWRDYSLEVTYHRLCESPQVHIVAALNGFVEVMMSWPDFAKPWAETILQAGEDSHATEILQWGSHLSRGSVSYQKDHLAEIDILTSLLESGSLERKWHTAALVQRGMAYGWMSRYAESLADLTEALDQEAANVWAIFNRGWTYVQMGRYQDALADLSRAIELEPDNYLAIYYRGEVQVQLGKFSEALVDFNRLVELTPTSISALNERGVILGQLERYTDSLADFNRAIELDPVNSQSLLNRGWTYLQLGRYECAIADLTQAIELEPDNTWALYFRGRAYNLVGNYVGAVADLSQVLKIQPDKIAAIFRRAETYRHLGCFEYALADYDRGIELRPGASWALAGQGLTHYLMGDSASAQKCFTQAIGFAEQYHAENPTNFRNALHLAMYHIAIGEGSEAKRIYEEVLKSAVPVRVIRDVCQELEDFLQVVAGNLAAERLSAALRMYLQETSR